MPSPFLTLRQVSVGEADQLAELRVEAMRPSLEAIGRFDYQRARERFLSTFDSTLTREILLNGERVGFVVVRPAEGALLLDHLYISPNNQGQGLGSATVRTVIEEARAAGKTLRVGALKQSPSNAFYVRHGFELIQESEWDNHYVLRSEA